MRWTIVGVARFGSDVGHTELSIHVAVLRYDSRNSIFSRPRSQIDIARFMVAAAASAANVKVTPLGRHNGEFCRLDNAMVFEEPDGLRSLDDAGCTVV